LNHKDFISKATPATITIIQLMHQSIRTEERANKEKDNRLLSIVANEGGNGNRQTTTVQNYKCKLSFIVMASGTKHKLQLEAIQKLRATTGRLVHFKTHRS
jgi:hypothetical protein